MTPNFLIALVQPLAGKIGFAFLVLVPDVLVIEGKQNHLPVLQKNVLVGQNVVLKETHNLLDCVYFYIDNKYKTIAPPD